MNPTIHLCVDLDWNRGRGRRRGRGNPITEATWAKDLQSLNPPGVLACVWNWGCMGTLRVALVEAFVEFLGCSARFTSRTYPLHLIPCRVFSSVNSSFTFLNRMKAKCLPLRFFLGGMNTSTT